MSGDNVKELPDRDRGDGLTVRQRKVLEVIRNSVDHGVEPPHVTEERVRRRVMDDVRARPRVAAQFDNEIDRLVLGRARP